MRWLLAILVLGWCGSWSIADTVTLNPSKDNTLFETSNLSNGKGIYLFAGRTDQTSGAIRRAIMAFDVAGSIPAGSTITSASLTLNLSKTISDAVDVSLHRALADWSEGAANAAGEEGRGIVARNGDSTWSHSTLPDIRWTNEGGDFSPTASATSVIAGRLGKYTWDSTSALVADVQSWLDNPATSFGWFVLGNEETRRSTKRFDSLDNTNANNRPSLLVEFTPRAMTPGDFDGNGVLDAADIDALTTEVLAGTNQARFDLNGDQVVNDADRTVWVVDLRRTYFGDSTLDGEFSSSDLVAVFVPGQYEDAVERNSTWATGDWNGDLDFNTSDLVTAFTGGGFEVGPRPAVESVPEPATLVMALMAALPFAVRVSRRNLDHSFGPRNRC